MKKTLIILANRRPAACSWDLVTNFLRIAATIGFRGQVAGRRLVMLLSLMSSFAYADTCPAVKGLDFMRPPAGWKLLLPPAIEGQTYSFGAAIHSLNGAYYYQQVICKYEACPSHFCPAFALISDKTYQYPNTKTAPWDSKSVLGFTFTCVSPDHDPAHCVFS